MLCAYVFAPRVPHGFACEACARSLVKTGPEKTRPCQSSRTGARFRRALPPSSRLCFVLAAAGMSAGARLGPFATSPASFSSAGSSPPPAAAKSTRLATGWPAATPFPPARCRTTARHRRRRSPWPRCATPASQSPAPRSLRADSGNKRGIPGTTTAPSGKGKSATNPVPPARAAGRTASPTPGRCRSLPSRTRPKRRASDSWPELCASPRGLARGSWMPRPYPPPFAVVGYGERPVSGVRNGRERRSFFPKLRAPCGIPGKCLTTLRSNRRTMTAISQEALMRSASLFRCPTLRPRPGKLLRAFRNLGFVLAVVFPLGCGTRDPKILFGTSFNPPALTTLEPATVPVNSTPFVLTVNGKNFGADAVGFWNNVRNMPAFVGSPHLQFPITPAARRPYDLRTGEGLRPDRRHDVQHGGLRRDRKLSGVQSACPADVARAALARGCCLGIMWVGHSCPRMRWTLAGRNRRQCVAVRNTGWARMWLPSLAVILSGCASVGASLGTKVTMYCPASWFAMEVTASG